MDDFDFEACTECSRYPETKLCTGCLHNRWLISKLRRANEALTNVYVVAARLRTFPVPFNDHFDLCGTVDECRSVIEPPTVRIYEKER